MKKLKPNLPTVLLFLLLFFTSKLDADESVQCSGDTVEQSNPPVDVKSKDPKPDENDQSSPNVEDKNENVKEEVQPHATSSDDDSTQNSKNEEISDVTNEDSKDQNNVLIESELPSAVRNRKNEDTKLEETNHSESTDARKQNEKADEINYKNNLNEINSYTADESNVKHKKRETRYSEFLGLPRDASYFFDDLQPFINNNSDNRVGRAVPPKESKNLKSRFSGEGKEQRDDDVEEDDEEVGNEEEDEKINEEDYDDDDEDMDSDCQPTSPACTSSTTCQPETTTTSTVPTTTKRTTTKTKDTQCSTTACRTTQHMCTTKCPRICAKANRKQMGYRTTEDTVKWDTYRKKIASKKRKNHNRVSSGY